MENLFKYLETSNPLHDVIYASIILVALIVVVFLIIILKKNGLFVNLFGFIRTKSEENKKDFEETHPELPTTTAPPSHRQPVTTDDINPYVTYTADLNNITLSEKEKAEIESLKKEKDKLLSEFEEMKNKHDDTKTALEKIEEENDQLQKTIDLLNKALKVLKTDKHPDVLSFSSALEKVIENTKKTLFDIVDDDKLYKYRDKDLFKDYLTDTVRDLMLENIEIFEKYFEGHLITNFFYILNDGPDAEKNTKEIKSILSTVFIELRKNTFYYHKQSTMNYKNDVMTVDKLMDEYLSFISKTIIKYYNDDIKRLTAVTPDKLIKDCCNKSKLVELCTEVGINAVTSYMDIVEKQRIESRNIIEKHVLKYKNTLEKLFKIRLVDKVLKSIENKETSVKISNDIDSRIISEEERIIQKKNANLRTKKSTKRNYDL